MSHRNRGAKNPPLGRCPGCDVQIAPTNPVIKYEPAEGWPRMLAECSACGEAVHPL